MRLTPLFATALLLALPPGAALRAVPTADDPALAALARRGVDTSGPVGARVAMESSLQPVMVHRYTMSGKVRPLLFWFGKDDIGLARIVWRRSAAGERGYEFLVGTDPSRAPRAVNRWGYIAESVMGMDGSLLAMMTGSDEASYDEAAASAAHAPGEGDFRAIASEIHAGAATWQVARVRTPAALTVHDVDSTLERVRRETSGSRRRQMPVPAGARPGFLTAVAELIDEAVHETSAGTVPAASRSPRVQYVFGQGAYELRVRDLAAQTATLDGRTIPVVRQAFEIRTLATDARTRFEVTSGVAGDLAGVPVAISWQPRWWLKVDLRLAPPRR